MTETTKDYHILCFSVASALTLISSLPEHDIRDDSDDLLLKSAVILLHAAVEEYLEQVSLSTLQECIEAFKTNARLSDSLLSALAYYKVPIATECGDRLAHLSSTQVMESILAKCFERHIEVVQSNHGIKQRDQDSVLLPIGVSVFEFDKVLAARLNSLGEKRGDFAHRFRIRTKVPRKGVEADAELLLRLILPLDQAINSRSQAVYS